MNKAGIRALLVPVISIFLIYALPAGAGEYFDRGVGLLREKRFEEAMKAFSAAMEKDPASASLYNSMGVCRFYTGDLDGAIDDYTKAVRLDAADPEPLKNRGGAWFYLKAYDNAIADYTRAIRMAPDDAEAYYHRGVALYFKGNYTASINDYKQVLRIHPDDAAALNQIAWTLATCPDPDVRDGKTAVTLAEKAMSLHPELQYLDTLAAAYAAAFRYEDAAATQRRVIEWLRAAGREKEVSESRIRLKVYQAGKNWTIQRMAACDQQTISSLIEAWRRAWESADLPAYVKYYHPGARQGKAEGLKVIAAGKERLWQGKSPLKITLGPIQVSHEMGQCLASFKQEYTASDGYRDKGTKTLVLSAYGNRWLIMHERWQEKP